MRFAEVGRRGEALRGVTSVLCGRLPQDTSRNMSTTNNQRKGTSMTHIEHSAKIQSPRTGFFAVLDGLLRHKGSGAPKIIGSCALSPLSLLPAILLVVLCGLTAALPATASAYATIEGPPTYSNAPGLPDGRVYELVSPGDKFGNEAGGSTSAYDTGAEMHYGLTSADGNAVLFEGTGPMGESPSGSSKWFVATKTMGEPGWSTRSVTPAESAGAVNDPVVLIDPSSDLSHAMVFDGYLPKEGCTELFLTGPDPFVGATDLARTGTPGEVEDCGLNQAMVGGTPDFSTVYFTNPETLLPEDTSRAPYTSGARYNPYTPWGFYEYSKGVLREAGVLPDGLPSPFGAVPAASGHGHNAAGNEVSADGSRAFFVSPDPASCQTIGGPNDCATNPPELYVRENGERTLLVSRDTLLSETGGSSASAPGGVWRMPNQSAEQLTSSNVVNGSYVFASLDGSQAFFQSTSALTKPAEEASQGAEPKTYDFDVNSGTLTYLPGVVGEIVTTDRDGSAMAFVRSAAAGEPAQLELWSAGPGGGSVTAVTQLPEPGADVHEARLASDGPALVFQTASRLSSAFNSGGKEEIYRYDVPANTLGCVSCAPVGVMPRGAASMSIMWTAENDLRKEFSESISRGLVDERGISTDGDRVFFESVDPLVPQDSNTDSPPITCAEQESCPQGSDVYEWENGVVYLISTGKGPLNSYLLDSSENGDDVFFATAEGLVPGDVDGGYDVYDARVPHPGEPFPPAAVPCEGSVCQGPPNVPSPLTPPASATFSGLGNPAPTATPPSRPAKTTTKTVKCKKNYVRKNGTCVKLKPRKKAKKASNERRVK
jgi:hypothetical protein